MDNKLKEYTSDFPSHYMSVIHSTLSSSNDGAGGTGTFSSYAEYRPFKLQNSKTAAYMKARNRVNATIAKNTLHCDDNYSGSLISKPLAMNTMQ